MTHAKTRQQHGREPYKRNQLIDIHTFATGVKPRTSHRSSSVDQRPKKRFPVKYKT